MLSKIVSGMRIQLNQVLRSTSPGIIPDTQAYDNEGIVNLYALTSHLGWGTSLNVQRPMFHHAKTRHESHDVTPVMYFHSNPFKTDRNVKPWTDILLPDEGFVYYNGDNQTPGLPPAGKQNSGNRMMERLWPLYFSSERNIRQSAPPIIIFEQCKHNNSDKGYRRFVGYGIVTRIEIRQEYSPNKKTTESLSCDSGKVFSNYLFEISLLKVHDDSCLDWDWIKDRRDGSVAFEDINRLAPKAWRNWVKDGHLAIERNRQKILHYEVSHPNSQAAEIGKIHKKILDEIITHYPESKNKGKFEALASLVTSLYFGVEKYDRGWITKQSGDMGVDFVGCLKIFNEEAPKPPGTVLGHTKLLVIGQAKCRTNYMKKAEDAKDIARVASRLQRGYLGVYVTTGQYKESTQKEVSMDGYPIILINGRQVADLLNMHSLRTGQSIKEILIECDEFYRDNQSNKPPEHILRDSQSSKLQVED